MAIDPLGLAECSINGVATVRQYHGGGAEGHFSIEIKLKGKKSIETHQVGDGPVYSRFGMDFPSKTYILSSKQLYPGDKIVKSVDIELTDAVSAHLKQIELMNAGDLGKYFPSNNSCLTHVTDVLESGGEVIGKGGKALKAFAEKYGFKHL